MSRPRHYETLGVSPAASPREIKSAYREMAFKFHPDRNPGDPMAEKLFKDVGAAYDVLKDSRKRQAYDRTQQTQAPPPRADAPEPPPAPRARTVRRQWLPEGFLEELDNLVGLGFSLTRVNAVCFVLLALSVEMAYGASFAAVYKQPVTGTHGHGGVIYSLFHFVLFLWWLLFLCRWHWLFLPMAAGLTALAVKGHRPAAGAALLALQLLGILLLWIWPTLLKGFAIFYEPLFTIAPLTPQL